MPIYSKKQAQIEALIFDKALIIVLAEYFDYSNVFSAEYIIKLPEYIGINDYMIKLEEDK